MASNNQNPSFNKFTAFLKEYYNLAALVAPIILVPVTNIISLSYKSQALFLMTFSFLACLVCIWLIFSLRNNIESKLFNFLPYIFIFIGFLSIVFYYSFLQESIKEMKIVLNAAKEAASIHGHFTQESVRNLNDKFGESIAKQIMEGQVNYSDNSFILNNTQMDAIPNGLILLLLFIAILLCFESTFILLTLRDFVRSDRQSN
ncbi:hypothetical protein ACE1CI_11640 [Aerosakkonemataceae cyanobacterium BLCC-F50]|uniref:Uncharacterized protein n=1 Tax=Floridaenema flaviceps BLCC-F50 TaxID=3153642 RepID=A0ABV4XRH9_9CYAN